jgi:hypothetical protein
MTDDVRSEALRILETLVSLSFENCAPVSKDFPTLTTKHSLYAIRHRTEGLLYIGKSQNPKLRFTGGHKALVWCWLEGHNPNDVRVATYPLDYRQWSTLSLELEGLILRATQPPFNVKIPIGE